MDSNTTGKHLERIISDILKKKGFEVIAYSKWNKNKDKYGKDILIKDYPFKTIYHTWGKTEFLIISQTYHLNLRVECKWQQVRGSVDEKYPYLYLNAVETMQEDVAIILDGGGYRKEAREWIINAISERKYQSSTNRKIKVFSLSEFIKWVNSNFA
jgi:hypothetical protein